MIRESSKSEYAAIMGSSHSAISKGAAPPSQSGTAEQMVKDEGQFIDESTVRINLLFPNEILEKITSFLSIRDKLIAREVCLDWMHHINSASGLPEMVKVKICTDELTHLIDSPLDPVFDSFCFHKVDVTRQSVNFWRLYSEHITHLEFFDCSVIPRNNLDSGQTEFVLGCPNLRHLSLVNCDKYFLMGGKFIQLNEILCLENLETLNLSSNKNLTDNILFSILLRTKKLKSLDLSDCTNMVFMKAVHNRFYPAGIGKPAYSDHVLSFHKLYYDFLQTERATHMKEFNFGMKFNSIGLQLLIANENTKWECANLESPELKATDLFQFINTFCSSLRKLELGRCKLTSEQLLSLNLFLLEDLSLHDSRNIGDLNFLLKIPGLKQLTIDGICGFDLYQEPLSSLSFLTTLSMNGIKPNGDTERCREQLIGCLRKLVNLEVLDVGNCPALINDTFVQAIIRNLRNLKRLNLEGAPVSDHGLAGKPDGYTDLGTEANTNRSTFHAEVQSRNNLSELEFLEMLNLSHCKDVGDLGWQAIKLPNLVSLNLSHCSTLSKKGILSIINNCKNIEHLILIHCSLQIISDSEILNAARESLYRCKMITY